MSNIDWSLLITKEMRDAEAVAAAIEVVKQEISRRRKIADHTIAPLQDAVDIGEASEEETLLLTTWKRYRIALSKVTEQEGYHVNVIWPEEPA